MKILLLFPPQDQIVSPGYMKTIQEGLGFLPSLGLLYLGTYLRERTRHEVDLLDAYVERMTFDDVEQYIRRTQPDAVGIGAMTFTLIDAVDAARVVKRVDPSIPVVLGGPHTALFPRESVDLAPIDYVVMGEGEIPLAQLLDRLEESGRLRGAAWRGDDGFPVDGTCITDDIPAVLEKRTTMKKHRFFVNELDTLPLPRRELGPYTKYSTVVSRRPPTTIMVSSRGCPYACSFCYTAGGKKYRERSPAEVVAEMKACIELGIREFLFFDETFTINKERIRAVCDEIIRSRIDVTWDVRARVDCVDADLLQHMRRAGCGRVQYGIESGTQRVMDILNKGTTLEQARDAIRWTHAAGLSSYADFMIGAPGETREEILQTLRFADSLKLDYVHFSVTMPLPNTPLHHMAVRQGIITDDTWRDFAQNPTPAFQVPYWTELFTRDELDDLVTMCIKRTYLRPSYLLRSLGNVRSMGELVRKARAGVKLAMMGL
ncbi:MAG: radical SAM protein [Proteobacteria bacterium]|nr:radical SAM protein [Pseudomonadota bacterium]